MGLHIVVYTSSVSSFLHLLYVHLYLGVEYVTVFPLASLVRCLFINSLANQTPLKKNLMFCVCVRVCLCVCVCVSVDSGQEVIQDCNIVTKGSFLCCSLSLRFLPR